MVSPETSIRADKTTVILSGVSGCAGALTQSKYDTCGAR